MRSKIGQRLRDFLRSLSLAQQFRLASLIILVLGLAGIGAWVQRQVENAILHSTATTTASYVGSFVTPELWDLVEGKPISQQHLQTLSRLLKNTPLGAQVVTFKLWGPDGLVLYDTDQSTIGQSFAVEDRLKRAWAGETTSRISNLESDENAAERRVSSQLLETYTPVRVRNPDRIIAVAEFYQNVDTLQADITAARRDIWLVVTATMLLIYLLLSGFVQRASDTIAAQQARLTAQVSRLQELLSQNEELNERVRRSAAQTAALNERFLRRISAELHDGPAQEISLALLRIDPGATEDAGPAGSGTAGVGDNEAASLPEGVEPIRAALRHALEEIRAISSGLGLPELERVALPEVVQRAVRAHERRTGTRVATTLVGAPEAAPLATKITVYRLIQEALTNAYRHAGGAGQEVLVKGEDDELRVEVCDRGPGFDTAARANDEGRLGLLGMRERVQSLGGIFSVESKPGEGTRVVACLPLGRKEGSDGAYGG